MSKRVYLLEVWEGTFFKIRIAWFTILLLPLEE
jgi:hypothetical protein